MSQIQGKQINVSSLADGTYIEQSNGKLQIADGGVVADKIASNAVTTAKINNGAVETAKINDDAVTTAKINNGAVETAKINDEAVTNDKMAANSVDSAQIVAGSVDNAHLAGSIVASKMDNGIFEDLESLGPVSADGEIMVGSAAGVFAYESGNVARTSLGLGTGNSPQFTDLVLTGDLQIDGSIDTRNVTELVVEDLTIECASEAADSSAANNAGLKITGAGASLLWDHGNSRLDINKPLNSSNGFIGALTGNADTATIFATSRTIAMTGDVVWNSGAFNGSADVTAGATIQADAVTEGKIADSAVATDKLAANAVTNVKITDSTIQNAKLANSAISGISLGGSLNDLTATSSGGLQFANGSDYDGSTARELQLDFKMQGALIETPSVPADGDLGAADGDGIRAAKLDAAQPGSAFDHMEEDLLGTTHPFWRFARLLRNGVGHGFPFGQALTSNSPDGAFNIYLDSNGKVMFEIMEGDSGADYDGDEFQLVFFVQN